MKNAPTILPGLLAGVFLLSASAVADAKGPPRVTLRDDTTVADNRYGQPLPKPVVYSGKEPAGTIIIDKPQRRLYLVQDDGYARMYPIAVGKGASSPTGVFAISAKRENPSWTPTPNMRRKNSRLHAVAGGSPKNPLGPRALYIGDTLFRIHGTIHPESIGHAASSGCFRMFNDDVRDLYARVPVQSRVVVTNNPAITGIGNATGGTQASPL